MRTTIIFKMILQSSLKMLALFAFLCLSVVAYAQLTVYPALSGIQGCQFNYTLQARVSGTSTWSTVPLYNVSITNQNGSAVNSTIGNLDCNGPIEIQITYSTTVTSAAVYPASLGITPTINGSTITFTIAGPQKFYVNINGDHYNGCIHVIADPLEVNPPQPGDPNVIYIPTGTNNTNYINLNSNQTLYVQGGAAIAGVSAYGKSNVKILGRGFIYRAGFDAINVQYANNVTIDGLIDLNHGWGGSGGCGMRFGNSSNISVSNTASFSSKTWGDGYDIITSNNVTIDNVFMRTNDDAITFYGGGKTGNTGNCKNITVTNSVLLPDLAQPIHVGVYGDQYTDTEIRDVTVSNVDIDDWSRTPGRPVIYFTVGDRVRAANFQFNNVRTNGYMPASFSKSFLGMAIVYNGTYNWNAGRQIDSVYYNNCSYTGSNGTPGSSFNGYDANRIVKDVFINNMNINGTTIANASQGNISIGSYTSNIVFSSSPYLIPIIYSTNAVSIVANTSFSYAIKATNSPTSYSATGLPSGLSIDTSTGIISGTPTGGGTFNVAIQATNLSGTGNKTLSIVVIPLSPAISSTISANGTEGQLFSYSIVATNSPVSYNATGLPTGLSINTSSGVISGTPILAGTYPLTISATNSYGTGSATLTLTISLGVPSPWNHADIGATGALGSVSYSSGTFTINGAGTDIWGTADAFHYVYQPISGDCQIIARVTGVQNTNATAKGGVMIRESLNANSAYAGAYLFPSNNAVFEYRSSTGGSAVNNTSISTTIPYWLKLVRSGNLFSAFRSSDGITWSQLGSTVTISMASNMYVGLPVCSKVSGTLCTTTVDNVSVIQLPSPWNHADVGTTGATGNASYNGGIFTISGAGADIWGSADAFHYVYQQIIGNCDIRIRVATLQNTNSNSKAGVMIRESLNANSTHALVDVTPSAGVEFIKRTTTGGSTTAIANSGITAPQWLRLVRSGTTFTAYRSTNGTTWTTIGSSTIMMNASVYVGMAVNSHVNGTLCTATIDSASVLRSDTIVWYKFNETTGTTASDASGNGNNGTLNGGASFVAGQTTNALSLNGSTGYVSAPAGVISSLTDFTISAWIKMTSTSQFTRVWDFGTGTSAYMFLTPYAAGNVPRFSITTSGYSAEQQINGTSALPVGSWVHVVVTLSGNTGTLYINGTAVGTNNNITIKPTNLGNTTQNYIGRSQFSGDPYFNGLIDDFRIYGRALSSTEVSSLTNGAMKSAKFIPAVESVDQSSDISLYPNPVTSTLIISTANMKVAKIEIYNTSGTLVFSKIFDSNQMLIDMSGVPSGIYIIRINDGEKLILKKIVKK